MLNTASKGAIVNKTPQEARELISIVVATSQQFSITRDTPQRVNEVSISSLESEISELIHSVQNIAMTIGNT